jgi:methyltransferase family protein
MRRIDHSRNEPRFAELSTIRLIATMKRGDIGLEESGFLISLVQSSDPARPIVEIGTHFGFSTSIIAAAKHKRQPLITVDNFDWNALGLTRASQEKLTRHLLDEAVKDLNCSIVRSDKNAFYRNYSGPAPALAFLDANHEYAETLKDIQWAKSAGASIICGHDYHAAFPGVIQAVDESGGAAKVVDSLWLLGSAG